MTTPAHSVLSVQQSVPKTGMSPVPHPPYSLDLAPGDFVSPDLKKNPQRKMFCQRGRGETKSAEALIGIKNQ